MNSLDLNINIFYTMDWEGAYMKHPYSAFANCKFVPAYQISCIWCSVYLIQRSFLAATSFLFIKDKVKQF